MTLFARNRKWHCFAWKQITVQALWKLGDTLIMVIATAKVKCASMYSTYSLFINGQMVSGQMLKISESKIYNYKIYKISRRGISLGILRKIHIMNLNFARGRAIKMKFEN